MLPNRYKRLVADYQAVFSTPAGKNVLMDLARSGRIGQTSMVAGDPQATAFFEGKRAIVLEIFNKLKTDMSALVDSILEDEDYDGE